MFRHVDAALKLSGMTRGDLARAIGVSPSTMSQKLNGKSSVTLEEAKAIKAVLGTTVTIEELFDAHSKREERNTPKVMYVNRKYNLRGGE